jgi:hypothetical protein
MLPQRRRMCFTARDGKGWPRRSKNAAWRSVKITGNSSAARSKYHDRSSACTTPGSGPLFSDTAMWPSSNRTPRGSP